MWCAVVRCHGERLQPSVSSWGRRGRKRLAEKPAVGRDEVRVETGIDV
jgi:hypothetical protein